MSPVSKPPFWTRLGPSAKACWGWAASAASASAAPQGGGTSFRKFIGLTSLFLSIETDCSGSLRVIHSYKPLGRAEAGRTCLADRGLGACRRRDFGRRSKRTTHVLAFRSRDLRLRVALRRARRRVE